MQVSEDFKQYLSGFFDGDGSIIVEKQNNGYCLRIKFFQSNENWINTIQRYYPILKKSGSDNRDDNSRIEYQLRAAGKQIEPLVDDLLKYSILKYEQLLEAKKFINLINVVNKNEEKKEIYLKLKKLKKESDNKPYERLSINYITGLFDAEGSIGVYNNSLRVKLTQKSDIIILQKIANMYNNKNKIDNYAISFYGENSLKFLNDMLALCIYKKSQIKIALQYIDTINIELTDEVINKRKEYLAQLSNEKHIDINTNDTFFKNQESNKVFLRNAFKNFEKMSYNEVLMYCKLKEIEEMKTFTKLENKIFNCEDWQNLNIKPILEFCETNNQLQLYQYYRKKVSSLPSTGVVGRAIRILIKDSLTNNYIGIMCLSSDVYNLGDRDIYIKSTSGITDKNIILKQVMNLSCCVPLQPFGFNTTGGKLIASLAFSKEIFEYYQLKYKEPLLAIITTSINGKSIQYDRLKCLKMIGYTKGFGSVNIPNELYNVCQEYNNTWKVIQKSNRIDRFTFLKELLKHLELSQDILLHKNKRGIYFGYLFSSKLSNDYHIEELKTVTEIFLNWKEKYCNKRICNLIQRNNIKKTFDLYTIDNFIDNVRYELPKIQEKIITDNLIKEILTYKSREISQEELCKLLNKKYNIELLKSDISRIYTGKLLPHIQDDEYKSLLSIKNSKKKITDDQIYFILDYHEKNKPSYSVIVNEFNKKYGTHITKATVSDVILDKIKPNTVRRLGIKEKNKNLEKEKDSKFKLLTEEQLKIIINMKHNNTTQAVTDYIKEHFNVYINRNAISNLWNGKIDNLSDEIVNSQEYKNMLENTKQRTICKKFTKEEINWALSNNLDQNLTDRTKLFQQKFNKTITKAYLIKLK